MGDRSRPAGPHRHSHTLAVVTPFITRAGVALHVHTPRVAPAVRHGPHHCPKYHGGEQWMGSSSQRVFSLCAQEATILFLSSSDAISGPKLI